MLEENQISERIQQKSNECFSLWGVSDLASSVVIQFSGRLRTALGRTCVDKRIVRLNLLLSGEKKQFLEEVLCHELAHVAVYERFGGNVRPHGHEWAALMLRAGYVPRLRIDVGSVNSHRVTRRYEHLCPVCQLVRFAKRPVRRWRCERCIEVGLDGHLQIRSVGKV